MIIDSIQAAIGDTLMLRFTHQHFAEIPEGSALYAKLEYLNPGGSIKDRLGMYLVKEGIAQGKISTGTTIIEPTAGNTGIGVALAALAAGLPTIFVVPEKFSLEKQALMRALGRSLYTRQLLKESVERSQRRSSFMKRWLTVICRCNLKILRIQRRITTR